MEDYRTQQKEIFLIFIIKMKTKKKKKTVRMRGTTTHGWGARKQHKGSGHRGGYGMAGTGKRGDQKKTLITKKYGKGYFGKKGITSKRTKKKKIKVINLRDIEKKFGGKKEIDLSDYKILGDGEIKRVMVIKAKAFTKSAKDKIERAGGRIVVRVEKEKKIKDKSNKPEEDKK